MSPAQAFSNSAEMETALSYQMPAWGYTRIANPSTFFLEETMALLETYGSEVEASALSTSSGMSAIRTATDLGRVKTVATLNSISTHHQQGEEGRALAAIKPNVVRISAGIEDPSDIIADLQMGLENI